MPRLTLTHSSSVYNVLTTEEGNCKKRREVECVCTHASSPYEYAGVLTATSRPSTALVPQGRLSTRWVIASHQQTLLPL